MIGDHGRFVWYELMTTDAAAAQRFYASVVGWDAQEAATSELDYTLLTSGGIPVCGLMGLPQDALKKGATPRWTGYVAVADVAAIAEAIKRRGGAVYVPPTDTNIGRIAVVADPQTATFALVEGLKVDRPASEAFYQPGHVGWHELFAVDREAAFAFYSAAFGWQRAEGEAESPYQLFSLGDDTIGGMFTKPAAAPIPFWLYYFNVDDLDAALRRTKAGGGQVFEGPLELADDVWMARCRDPLGALFALRGARSREAIERDPVAELGWSSTWGGFSSRGRVVVDKRRK